MPSLSSIRLTEIWWPSWLRSRAMNFKQLLHCAQDTNTVFAQNCFETSQPRSPACNTLQSVALHIGLKICTYSISDGASKHKAI